MSKSVKISLIILGAICCVAIGFGSARIGDAPSLIECAQLLPNESRFGATIDMEIISRPDHMEISNFAADMRSGSDKVRLDERVRAFRACLVQSAGRGPGDR